ncbi:MAG: prenyltransferase [Deltaproteobacteria bacterium CG_4_9_14_3_um_filter_63_12]|nr:MAG: prenyltransferase [Deltaproteobacteria bacterium CG_4_9_14_3_um_filter_63_12]
MSSKTLTLESPLPTRFLAWMNERFPFSHGILFFVLYATALLAGRFSASSAPLTFGLVDLLGFLPAWCFFFMLRIFDEHKDYELDCQNYPQRVLQSGLITLKHLKVAGAFAIGTQLVGSLALDWHACGGSIGLLWSGVFVYSLLMAKEFFVSHWLARRLVLYAVSHLVVMPIAMLWMAQMGAGAGTLAPQIGLLAGLSFLSAAAFEVTRKLRAPEEERESVQSYTQVLGVRRAPILVMGLLAGSTALQVVLVHWVLAGAVSIVWYLVLGAGLLMPIVVLQRFRSTPTIKNRKANEGLVSLAMLMSYLVVVTALIVERGLSWG